MIIKLYVVFLAILWAIFLGNVARFGYLLYTRRRARELARRENKLTILYEGLVIAIVRSASPIELELGPGMALAVRDGIATYSTLKDLTE